MFVYKEYDQESLDAQYNNRLHVPDYADYFGRWDVQSREAEQTLAPAKDLAYGNLKRERLDIYPSPKPHSKVLVFIHGGYWHLLDKSLFQFIAKGFHSYGITTVLLNYPLAPEVSIDHIVLSCRNAVHWLYGNLSAFNGDPEQMYIAGHSAGGHLAAMLMTTDWKAFNHNVPVNVLKGICTLSGLFNLVPLHLSYLNQVLRMDLETAVRNSPARLEPLSLCPVIIAVGEDETKEFNDQSKEFYTCWKERGIDVELLQLPGKNHFSIADAVIDMQSAFHRSLMKLIGIG